MKWIKDEKSSDKSAPSVFSISIVYDNYSTVPGLVPQWGFSCAVKTPDGDILFDTGGDPGTLLSNMEKAGIDPSRFEMVFISHIHGDHLGGINGLLNRNGNVSVFVPSSFPGLVIDKIESFGARCIGVSGPAEVTGNAYSTGEMGSFIIEQSLVLDTASGIIVITGCAHQGILNVIKQAREILADREIHLVMGGFHLSSMPEALLREIIREFRSLGVKNVAPSHCSGDLCRALFKEEYGDNCTLGGAGTVIYVP